MKTTSQLQFLQSFDELADDHCDLHLSEYNLAKVRKIKKLSPLRWVKGTNLMLKPGAGSGQITIGSETFTVTYAWGGRSQPRNPSERTSHTTRITGPNLKERIHKLEQQIIADEQGKTHYQISFRKLSQSQGTHNLADFVRSLKSCHSIFNLKQLTNMVNAFEKNWEENPMRTLAYPMRKIETDMLENTRAKKKTQ
jgi:hypothetical protein